MKNFGFGAFADIDSEETDMDPEMQEMGIFDGSAADEKKEYTDRIMDFFYGAEKEGN